MVRHIVLWSLKEEIKTGNAEELLKLKQTIKTGLEALKDKVPDTLAVQVIIDPQESSNRDLALIADFKDEAALAAYQQNPEHLAVAGIVRQVTENRACMDYEL